MDHSRQMFPATCSNCGNKCEVPFRPSGGKPVLCSDCFGNKGGGDRDRSGGRGRDRDRGRSGGRSRSGDREMHEATCDKCGKQCEVPFRPSGGKPIYCSNCFEQNGDRRDNRGSGGRDRQGGRDRRGGGNGGGNDQVVKQLKTVHDKIDRVLSLLEPGVILEKSQVEIDAGSFVPRKKTDKKKTTTKAKTKAVKKKVTKKKK